MASRCSDMACTKNCSQKADNGRLYCSCMVETNSATHMLSYNVTFIVLLSRDEAMSCALESSRDLYLFITKGLWNTCCCILRLGCKTWCSYYLVCLHTFFWSLELVCKNVSWSSTAEIRHFFSNSFTTDSRRITNYLSHHIIFYHKS